MEDDIQTMSLPSVLLLQVLVDQLEHWVRIVWSVRGDCSSWSSWGRNCRKIRSTGSSQENYDFELIMLGCNTESLDNMSHNVHDDDHTDTVDHSTGNTDSEDTESSGRRGRMR